MRLVVPIVAILLLAGPAAASSPTGGPRSDSESNGVSECLTTLVGRVQRYYDRVRDISAHFEQTTHSVTLGTSGGGTLAARGRVVFAKPGRMRWTYEAPEPSLVVSDGETLWVFDPSAREAQRLPVTEGFLSGAALEFLLGEGRIDESFDVASENCSLAPASSEARVRLELVPRRPTSYERFSLHVDPKTGSVLETSVHDLFGNRTHMVLREVETNRDPAPELFHFEPPEDVRVFDLPPPSPRP